MLSDCIGICTIISFILDNKYYVTVYVVFIIYGIFLVSGILRVCSLAQTQFYDNNPACQYNWVPY